MKRKAKQRIVFRADGNSTIGLGHVYRLLALVEICNNSFDCLFIIRKPGDKLSNLIRSYCNLLAISKEDEFQEMSDVLLPSDIVVLDGYQFNSDYQKKMRSLVHKLVVIDDTADAHFVADIIINHGGEQIKDLYSVEAYSKLLMGFPYLLLRKEFLRAATFTRTVSKVDTVFICMGGADPFNITIKALEACVASSFIKKVIVVTGSAFKNKEALIYLIANEGALKNIILEEDISAERMVEMIGKSEIAICPSSSVAMEVCCVKAGLLTGTVIENQSSIHKQILNAGCGISLGNFNSATSEDIQQFLKQLNSPDIVNNIMQNQANAIDGLSGERLVKEFEMLAEC